MLAHQAITLKVKDNSDLPFPTEHPENRKLEYSHFITYKTLPQYINYLMNPSLCNHQVHINLNIFRFLEGNINTCLNPLHREETFPGRCSCTHFANFQIIRTKVSFCFSQKYNLLHNIYNLKKNPRRFLWVIIRRVMLVMSLLGAWDSGSFSRAGHLGLVSSSQMLPELPGAALVFGRKWVPKRLICSLLVFWLSCFGVIFMNTTHRTMISGLFI